MKVLGLHIRETTNIGDRFCHPLDYFDVTKFADATVTFGDVRSIPTDMAPDVVVLGGGAIGKFAPQVVQAFPNAKKLAWGIGVTTPEMAPATEIPHKKRSRSFDLWGSRDFNTSKLYVPCSSCMHPLFDDQTIAPVHDVVAYGHAGRASLRAEAEALGIPYMENNDNGSFDAAIAHLRSGATVVTSSFHGAYWASILGRSVSMIPFGSKFFNLKYRPAIVETIKDGIKQATAFPEALYDCRAKNLTFFGRVIQSMGSK